MLRFAMHFASGNSLLSGLAMLLAAYGLVAGNRVRGRFTLMAVRLLVFLGIAFVVLSTTPMSGWLWMLVTLSVLPLVIRLMRPTGMSVVPSSGLGTPKATFMAIAIGVLWAEYGLAASPWPPSVSGSPIVVVGDSLSAAETDTRVTAWPALIAGRGWTVDNRARMGATAASAFRQAEGIATSNSIVLLVIGGNDVLGSTTPAQFEVSLDKLVRQLQTDGTTIVMFELALPPLQFEWGRIQRRVAERYGCRLVTRRVIAEVLGGVGNTVDGIHLSQKGHEAMARLVLERVLPEG